MTTIRAYHRPDTLEAALALLAHADSDATVLAGGTVINGTPDHDPIELVDLQGLGLDSIAADGDRLEIGAMCRLQDLVDSDLVPAQIRDLAHREAPNTIRQAATCGGTVAAADPESELLAGLLAFEAVVSVVHSIGSESIPLADLLEEPERLGLGIITSVSIAVGGDAVSERTARTPADRPIVMAVARRGEDGAVRLAMTGVAATPVLVDPGDVASLQPPGDFRGSTVYRRRVAGVLADRVMSRLGETS
ncbi:MAG: FAD binding domain-containing protein [Acidimicrobiia bacterium]